VKPGEIPVFLFHGNSNNFSPFGLSNKNKVDEE
jgi:hypothetical protein